MTTSAFKYGNFKASPALEFTKWSNKFARQKQHLPNWPDNFRRVRRVQKICHSKLNHAYPKSLVLIVVPPCIVDKLSNMDTLPQHFLQPIVETLNGEFGDILKSTNISIKLKKSSFETIKSI